MATQAPVMAMATGSPPVQGGRRPMSPEELEQVKRERAERERVITAVHLGEAVLNLSAHARLEKNGPDAAPRTFGSVQFPPDLFYRRNPETLLHSTCQKLLKLEENLLRLLKLEDTLLGPEQHYEIQQPRAGGMQQRPPRPDGAQQPPSKPEGEQRPPRPDGAQPPPRPARAQQPLTPSKEAMIETKIEQLIAYAKRNPDADLESYLSNNGVDAAICKWDALIVERIVDFPTVFSAYRAGKALSKTRWKIWEAKRSNSGDDNLYVALWSEAFGKKRIDAIKRHVYTLSTVLDPQAVAVVTTSLGYWREALLTLSSTEESLGRRSRARWRRVLQKMATFREPSQAQSVQPSEIKISPERGETLRMALDEQITNWLDVLTERRPLKSFPVVSIVTALTKKVAATWWKKLIRIMIIGVIIGLVLLVLGALTAVAFIVGRDLWNLRTSGYTGFNWSDLLASVGTAFVGVFTFMAMQGRLLFDRGAETINRVTGNDDPGEMRNRGGRWGSYGAGGFMGMFSRGSYGFRGPTGGQPGFTQDALSSVVEQIELEEYNLAVSDPLVRCFLALTGQESDKGDPKEEAERFLRSVYKEKSNLDRLLPAFKDLYKH